MNKKTLLILLIFFSTSQNIFPAWYDIFNTGLKKSMEQLQESFGKLQQEVSNMQFFKSSSIKRGYDQSKNNYYIEIEIPGYESKNIKVDIEKSGQQKYLMISAKQVVETQIIKKGKKKQVTTEKSEVKSFQTTESLPSNVKEREAKWHYKNGILTVKIPIDKSVESQKETISIPEAKKHSPALSR